MSERAERASRMVEAAGVEPASEVGQLRAYYTLSPSLDLAARFPEDRASRGQPLGFCRQVRGAPCRLARIDDAPSLPHGREERGTAT